MAPVTLSKAIQLDRGPQRTHFGRAEARILTRYTGSVFVTPATTSPRGLSLVPFLMRVLTTACRRAPPSFRSASEADRFDAPSRAIAGKVLRPAVGDHAEGHGVGGMVAAVPDLQPLAHDGIWRVTLAGEGFGRLVRYDEKREDRTLQLLQIDELSDEQLDTYDAFMHGSSEGRTEPPF